MRIVAATFSFLLAGAGVVFPPSEGQRVTARSIDVLVQRPDRSFVTSAGPGDVEVIIGGAPVRVDRVERVDGPVSIVLLVDLSLSAATSVPNQVPDPADPKGMVAALDREFSRKLPPTDRARVGWFTGSKIRIDGTFRSDRAALATAVTELLVRRGPTLSEAFGPSPMVDAVSEMVALLNDEVGRKAILLVSDGESSGNHLSLDDTIQRASKAGVAVHAMLNALTPQERGWSNSSRYPRNFDRGRLLSTLAGQTGGAFRRDDRFSNFSWGFTMPMPPFEYFFTAMHSSLRITFSGPALSPGASIDVKARDPKWLVSAPRWLPAGN